MAFGSTEHLSLRSAQHSKTIWHLKIVGFAGGLPIYKFKYLPIIRKIETRCSVSYCGFERDLRASKDENIFDDFRL